MVVRERVTLLQRLMAERNWTREETLDRLAARARTMQVRQFALSLRQLDRWLAGGLDGRPRPSTCRVVEAEFGHPVVDLLSCEPRTDTASPVAQPNVSELVVAAAHDSASVGVWIDSAAVSDFALASFRGRLTYLASEYVHAPLAPVFVQLVALRDELFEVLRQRPDPRSLRDVYFLAGATCGMLAFASGDLGHPGAAMLQAQTALACADKADHPALRAWISGNQAVTLDWYGRSWSGVDIARRAYAELDGARVPGTALARLASIEARALARLGDEQGARDALGRAGVAREAVDESLGNRDDLDQLGGIMTFPDAQQHFYAGSAYLRMKDAGAAETAACAAIAAYETGPAHARSYGDEALARIDVAAARLGQPRPDLDGVVAALEPVLALKSNMRLPALAGPLAELGESLGSARSRPADDLRASIVEFNSAVRGAEITV